MSGGEEGAATAVSVDDCRSRAQRQEESILDANQAAFTFKVHIESSYKTPLSQLCTMFTLFTMAFAFQAKPWSWCHLSDSLIN